KKRRMAIAIRRFLFCLVQGAIRRLLVLLGAFLALAVLAALAEFVLEPAAAVAAANLLVQQGILVNDGHCAAVGAGQLVLGFHFLVLVVFLFFVLVLVVTEHGFFQVVHILVHGVQLIVDLVQVVVHIGH